MKLHLEKEQREKISILELASHILRYLKFFVEKARAGSSRHRFETDVETFSLPSLQQQICPENKVGYEIKEKAFSQKFYEAIALLKQRRWLMDGAPTSPNDWPRVQLTSDGETANFDDEMPIQIDDAQEVVNFLKEKTPNLDSIVEQYYLESVQTYNLGYYTSSVLCLGIASERAILCLADAVIAHDDRCQKDINSKKRHISELTRYLSKTVKSISEAMEGSFLLPDLGGKLEGMASIYRINRNEAGHPKLLQNWQKSEQESHLKAFDRYVQTLFKAIEILENGKQNKTE